MTAKIPFFTRLGMWIDGFKLDKERVYSIEAKAETKKIRAELASAKGQIAKYESEKRKEQEEQKEVEREREVARKLILEDRKLRKEDLGECVSMNSFFRMLYFGKPTPPGQSDYSFRSKWGKQFKVTDRNEKFNHTFGEILFTEKGYMLITNIKKEVLVKVPLPQGLFRNYSSLINQLKLKRFVLGVDEKMDYVPNWDDIEIPMPVWNARKKEYEEGNMMIKARETIISLQSEIRVKDDEVDRLELLISNMKKDDRDARRKLKLLANVADNSNSDLSAIMEVVRGIMNQHHQQNAKVVALSEAKAMNDEEKIVLENSRMELLGKLQDKLSKTDKEEAKAEIQDMIDLVRKNFTPLQTATPSTKV